MRLPPILMCAALAGGAAAAPAAPMPAAGLVPLDVRREIMPVFPVDLLAQGVREGYLRVAIGVEADGTVDDCLPLDYSDSEFVPTTLACLREWTFDPVRVDGKPVPSTTQVLFHFTTKGTVVVSFGGGNLAMLLSAALLHVSTPFRTYDLRELDAIPRPIAAPAPDFPLGLARAGHVGEVTVHFYIDPTGAVRLPSVDPGADQQLAALAIAALQHWRFEPPRRHSRPVQVLASQTFVFRKPGARSGRGPAPG